MKLSNETRKFLNIEKLQFSNKINNNNNIPNLKSLNA